MAETSEKVLAGGLFYWLESDDERVVTVVAVVVVGCGAC